MRNRLGTFSLRWPKPPCNDRNHERREVASLFPVRGDPEWIRQYADYYTRIDPWAAGGYRLDLKSCDVAAGERLCPGGDLERTESATISCGRAGAFTFVAASFSENRWVHPCSPVCVPAGTASAEEQTRILQLLMPHMQRALQLHAQPQCQPDPQPERRTGCDPERSHGGSLRRHQSRQWPESAAAAVFVSDPESQPEPAATILRRLFNLTGAEARLAAAPMEGKSLEATAVEFRVSRDTVRAQLRSDSARQEPAVRGS